MGLLTLESTELAEGTEDGERSGCGQAAPGPLRVSAAGVGTA
ncbi:hypothetical protein [Paraburkholderia phenazinium]|nr:hypothetical protein [Paraburkholderia phenazinium]